MKVLIVSDSYKGSCSSIKVEEAIEKGIKKVDRNIKTIKIPIADGGDGTLESVIDYTGGELKEIEVLNPLGRPILARYGIINDNIAIIEMASSSGLSLLNEDELDVMKTTTYGTGQLIKAAINNGAKKIYVGVGGSATNDGGVGMAQALGMSFKDKNGLEIGYGGENLINIESIDSLEVENLLSNVEINVMSDVNNPLCGENGASYVYAEQKGANTEQIKILDKNLLHLSSKIKEQFGIDITNVKGSGAAGGLGGGLIAFCKANVSPGIEIILDLLDFDNHLSDVDLIITGEGRIDGQSINGKVPVGVARRVQHMNIPVVAIVGSIGEGSEKVYDYGIDAIVDIVNRPMEIGYAMKNAENLIERAAYDFMHSFINIKRKCIKNNS